MNNEQQQEAIELLGEAFDFIKDIRDQFIPENELDIRIETQELLDDINELLYSTI